MPPSDPPATRARAPAAFVSHAPPLREHVALPGGAEIRLLEEHDAGELHALIEANRAHLARWLPWAARQTRDDTLRFIQSGRAQLRDVNGCQCAVVDHARIVGAIGFHAIDWRHSSTSIGYWLAAAAQGRGTMTEAVSAMLDEALGVWGLHRVEIRASVENVRSRALIERIGLTFEGIARESFRLGAAFRDDAVYSMLAPEWRVLRAASS
jgi:ribosomal-protein-serine acetyltransferase